MKKRILYLLPLILILITTASLTYGQTTQGSATGLSAPFLSSTWCDCDLNHDTTCNLQDWELFGEDWGRTDCNDPGVDPCTCDLNADGKCDMLDWLLFGRDWGRTDCPPPPPDDIDYGLGDNEQQGGGGLVGKKIRILNGNNILQQPDLHFPSPNRLGLVFEAWYNSRSNILGPLGYGWSHTYGASLDPAFTMGDEIVLKIMDATGRAVYFQEQTPGLYHGIFKEPTYVRAEGGEYIWYRLDGTRYGFSDTGKLTWIADPVGNRLELTYNGQGRLETVTDTASGRMLSFHYNPEFLVSSISGPITEAVPDGIWVTYGYDAKQNLTTVTYADSSGFTYFYDDPRDAHNLTEQRNAMNHLLATWSYDEQDRCIDNYCTLGKGVSITYLNHSRVEVADAYGTLRTYALRAIEGRKRVVALQGPAWAPYIDTPIINWRYDPDLNLVETETARGTIHEYQDYDERGNPYTHRKA